MVVRNCRVVVCALMKEKMIRIDTYNGIKVLRDDLLVGGTKSILMPSIIGEAEEYVYASPVYGGFQIALAAYCQKVGKRATIFCAKRQKMHPNTAQCIQYGAKVVQVAHGYLSVVEKRARNYCVETGAEKLVFGAGTDANRKLIAQRMQQITKHLGKEPTEIWCAIGSGTLVEGILEGTNKAKVYGVQVGAEYKGTHARLTVMKYRLPFDKPSPYEPSFPSMVNYDLKAWETCNMHKQSGGVFFWNVL